MPDPKPKPYQFPQELSETTSGGLDLPGSSGDRERGRFRPSNIPRRTTVAVVSDEGTPIARPLEEILEELLLYQKAAVLGLSILTETDLLGQ